MDRLLQHPVSLCPGAELPFPWRDGPEDWPGLGVSKIFPNLNHQYPLMN